MAIANPTGTECSYNGFTFPPNIRTKVTEEPVWSGDGRVIKYSKITVHVAGYITQAEVDTYGAALATPVAAGATLDAFMLSIRRKLQVAGKKFVYKNKGYGTDLSVNDPGGIYDVAMGARPGKFTWWPLGGAPDGCHGAGFEWSIECNIVECGAFSNNPGPEVFLEISSTVTYDTAVDGLVTITTRGNAQIPLSLRATNTLVRNIDDCIATIIKPAPVGFLRNISRTLSADRASCQFSIVDTQIEVPYPEDVIAMDLKERIRQKSRYSPIWFGSISGTVRMSPTANKGLAWTRFMNIAAYRIAIAREKVRIDANARGVKANVIPGTIEMEENLLKNESRFTVNFDILGAPFGDIVKLSGLWRPLLNATDEPRDKYAPWTAKRWTASLRDNAQATKGLLRASFDTDGDVIIDVCAGEVTEAPVASEPDEEMSPDDIMDEMEGDEDAEVDELSLSVLGVEDSITGRFEPETSWIDWSCTVHRLTDFHLIRHKPLSGAVVTKTPDIDPLAAAAYVAADVSDPAPGWDAEVPDIVQQVAAPSMVLRLHGHGVRVNWRVNAPRLITYAGRPAILQRELISETILGRQDATIYNTEWTLDYLIPGAPQALPLPANPLLGIDGGGTSPPLLGNPLAG